MKTLYILVLTVCFSAFAKAENIEATCLSDKSKDMSWTGTFDTTFGQIILLQKGNYVVGTYRDLGAIRSTSIKGGVMELEFDNGKNKGTATLIRTVNGFTGYWGWGTKKDKGAWNGTKVNDASQNYIKGLWKTTYQDLEFIDSKTGIMVAHYGNNGGMLWGKMNHITDIFEGYYAQRAGAKVETCWFYFYNKRFEGKFNNRPRGSWNGWRPGNKPDTSSLGQAVSSTGNTSSTSSNTNSKAYLLKVTLNKLNFNKNNKLGKINMMDIQLEANMKIKNRNVPSRNSKLKPTNILHNDGGFRRWTLGESASNNNAIVFHISQKLNEISYSDEFEMELNVSDKSTSPLLPSPKRNITRDIHLKETIKFLTEATKSEDYPIAQGHDGRRRFPNSQDTFWLETIGGKRYIRGYGDLLLDDGKLRFGYHYTMELINKE